MRRSNLATLAYLLVVFVSGAVVGGFANRLYMTKSTPALAASKSRAQVRQEYLQEMRGRLHLTDPQMVQLNQIMDTTGQQMREMRKSIENEHVQKVIAMLNDSQKSEYAKMRDEREKRRALEAKKN